MKAFVRRHWIATTVAVAVFAAVAGVALAPWWIDLRPVRARIERAASTALGGRVGYERIDLSWFPGVEVVVRSLKVSVPGRVEGAIRTVHVSPAVLPLLRGKVVFTKIAVEGLDLRVDLDAPDAGERNPALPGTDWTQTLRSLGSQTLDVELSRSRVMLSRPTGRSLTFEGIRLEASLRAADGKAALTLSRLSAESPRFLLEGSVRVDASAPRVELAARGGGLDVTALRPKLVSFTGDDPVVASIFGIVRGGTLKSFSLASSGTAPRDLAVLERMSIRAVVEDAKVRIEGQGLDLADVRADVALEGGALTAEKASARVGKSQAFDGRVLVGLAKGDDRLRVEAGVKADLAEVPAILSRAIPDKYFRAELALVESLEGKAEGRITIGERRSAPGVSVSVSDMVFSARYGRLPWPVAVRGGRFFFDGKRADVSALSGSLGLSTFSDVAARVRLGSKPFLESGSGSVVVSLEDFFEGVRTRPGVEALARSVRRISGFVAVDVQRVAGPLARLGEASLTASGTFEEILFESSSSSLPPLSIASGRFAVDDDAVRVESVNARGLDASLRVSGVWSGWRGDAPALSGTVDGTAGPEAVRWGWERAALPAEFRPAAPIALHGIRFSLPGGHALSLAGDFAFESGPRVRLDLAADGPTIEVRDLAIEDGGTHASAAVRLQDGQIDARFRGRIEAPTLGKIIGGRRWGGGAVEGDVHALIPVSNPVRLSAEGTLAVTDVDVPTPAGLVTVESLDLRAAQNRFDVVSSSLVLDGQKFTVSGSATLGANAVALDLDSFAWRSYVWKPLVAEIRLGAEPSVSVRKADVCGLSTTGEARLLPGGAMAVDARVDAAGPDINLPLTCLGLENVRMTGAYEASVRLNGEGQASALARTVHGPLAFRAVKGRIGKANLFAKILGVLNATDVFAEASRTRVGEAIPYDEFRLDGDLANGVVSVREAALKAPSITMAATGSVGALDQALDLTVLAHPLSTVDKVVQAVPVVRGILGRDFLAVAVKVTGTFGDPKVGITPGRDVGKGLVGILERTVTLPVKVFDPPDSPEAR